MRRAMVAPWASPGTSTISAMSSRWPRTRAAGPNGAGKTTTVQILSTLISADSGQARVAGHDLVRDADAVRDSAAASRRPPGPGRGGGPAGARVAQRPWALWVSWIRCHDFGRTDALAGLSSAARACAAAGFDGVNSQVSKSEASGLPDTFSA